MALFSQREYISTADNQWVDRSTNSWKTAYVNLFKQSELIQVDSLLAQADLSQNVKMLDWVQEEIVQTYALRLGLAFVQQYGNASEPLGYLLQYYEAAGIVQSELVQKYRDALVALNKLNQSYTSLSAPIQVLAQIYAITASEVMGMLEVNYDLKSLNEAKAFLRQIYTSLNEDGVVTEEDLNTSVTPVIRTGTPVKTEVSVVGSGNITFTSPNTITSDGGPDLSVFTNGALIEIVGSGSNDGIYTVQGDSTSTTTTIVENVLVSESSQSPTINEVVFTTYVASSLEFSPLSIDITASLDSYVLTCTLQLTRDDFYKFEYLSDLTLTINATTFNFIVTQQKRTFAHGKADYTVTAVSKAVLLDSPHASPLNVDYPAGQASAIAQSIAAASGITLEWNIADWRVSANKLYANEESPLEVIRKLVQVPGGILQSNPNGTLRATYRYTDKLNDPQNPITLFLETGDNFITVSESYKEKPGTNKIFIGNQISSDEVLELSELDAEEGQSIFLKYLAGHVVPWTGNSATLTTSSTDVDSIQYMGIRTVNVTEEVEFVNGAGSVGQPVYGVIEGNGILNENAISVAWNDIGLGTVTFSEDGKLEAEVVDGPTEGNSIAEITYATRYYLWEVRKTKLDDPTQFLLSVDK